jgi:hypothetical protein
MNRSKGYLVASGPDGSVEHETFTCAHCSAVVLVRVKAPAHELGGMCHQCDAMICSSCSATGKCEPFEKKIEAYERRHRFLQNVG